MENKDVTVIVISTILFLVFALCVLCISRTVEIVSCKGNIACIEKLNKPTLQTILQLKEEQTNVK